LKEIKFEKFNIVENNIISVELAKVLRYLEGKPAPTLIFSPFCMGYLQYLDII
jgi:hypothetical protein